MRIGKLALAHSESGKIETQHADTAHRQPLGNALCREVVFAAREAVREQCEGNRLAERQIDQGRQFFAWALANWSRSVRMVGPSSLLMWSRVRMQCNF